MGHYFSNDDNLKSDIKEFYLTLNGEKFKFYTDNGVFSKEKLDFGSRFLIEIVLKENISGNILDLGCGYGVIGIILNKILNVPVTMIDINKRAIHLTKMNIKENNCTNINSFISDGYLEVDKKFNYIISNPPIRVNKKKLYDLIKTSKEYLLEDGKIYLVIRKEQGAKTFIRDFNSLYKIDILGKKKGFYVISLK